VKRSIQTAAQTKMKVPDPSEIDLYFPFNCSSPYFKPYVKKK